MENSQILSRKRVWANKIHVAVSILIQKTVSEGHSVRNKTVWLKTTKPTVSVSGRSARTRTLKSKWPSSDIGWVMSISPISGLLLCSNNLPFNYTLILRVNLTHLFVEATISHRLRYEYFDLSVGEWRWNLDTSKCVQQENLKIQVLFNQDVDLQFTMWLKLHA